MNPYDYYDEEEDSFYDEDREPDITSYTLTLCKDKHGNVYLHELVMGGWFGVPWSFGYPDTVLEEASFGLKAVVPELQVLLNARADKLLTGETLDVTLFCRQFAETAADATDEIPF